MAGIVYKDEQEDLGEPQWPGEKLEFSPWLTWLIQFPLYASIFGVLMGSVPNAVLAHFLMVHLEAGLAARVRRCIPR